MKTNLVSLRLIKSQSGTIRISLKYVNQPDDYESQWYISENELDFVISRLRGFTDKRYLVDDGNYHLGFGINGIVCHELSNDRVIRHYVTFPGELLATYLESLRAYPYQEDYSRSNENVITVSQDTISQFAFEYRNIAKVEYHNGDDYSVTDIIIRLCKDELIRDYFRRQLKSFVRQVGERKGMLHLYLDSWNQRNNKYPSLYFDVRDSHNERIYNGGIINHGDDITPNYSMHT